MTRSILESDWKLLSRLKPLALDRLCQRILSQIAALASGPESAHHRYGAIYGLIHERDREIANCFNGLSRSKALERLAAMRTLDLISDEELAGFSEETQSWVNGLRDFFRRYAEG